MITLGIETSCDETSVALVESGRTVLANVILSQAEHARFGGVVPEVASRVHVKTIIPIFREAMERAGKELCSIDLIAATIGPGLVGPLLVGLSFAKGLAFATGKPLVGVNHIEGHLAANFLEHQDLDEHHLALVVSGGHTLLIEINGFGNYRVVGRTRDDAAGEGFDKVAKLLDLGYPGGPRLDRLAQTGNPTAVKLPRAMRTSHDFNFSYSGLKTAVALYLASLSETERELQKADIAASFQEAAVEQLVRKTLDAAEACGVKYIAVSGGVAANSRLRSMLTKECVGRFAVVWPHPSLCTDNAAMIAAAGYFRYQIDGPSETVITAVPYLRLDESMSNPPN